MSAFFFYKQTVRRTGNATCHIWRLGEKETVSSVFARWRSIPNLHEFYTFEKVPASCVKRLFPNKDWVKKPMCVDWPQ
jgi:hypothetical protein